MVWNAAGTVEFLYMAPWAANPAGTSHNTTVMFSDVVRVPVATCSPGTPGSQTCSGTFTALDITASTSIWEIFDLANLVTNQAWATAGFAYPPLSPAGSALANQFTLGGFQLTWLNVHNAADPIVGFVADYGNFFVRHHASHALSGGIRYRVGCSAEAGWTNQWVHGWRLRFYQPIAVPRLSRGNSGTQRVANRTAMKSNSVEIRRPLRVPADVQRNGEFAPP